MGTTMKYGYLFLALAIFSFVGGCSAPSNSNSINNINESNVAAASSATTLAETPPAPQNQSEALNWGMTAEDFVEYATSLPSESLAIVQVTTDEQPAFLENAQLVAYQLAIRYFLFRASTGRVVMHTTPEDNFGPVDVTGAFTSSCSGLNPGSMFDILFARYPQLTQYRRLVILHNSNCDMVSMASGTTSGPSNGSYFYLRAKNDLPFIDGEDTGLPAISKILSGLMLTYGANSAFLARDGAYDDDWNFPQQGPSVSLFDYGMANHPYSIMGDVSRLPALFYLSKFPSPANLELAGWLDAEQEVVRYTQNSGPITVQLRNYIRSRQSKVLKIDYAPVTTTVPATSWSIYAYYNRPAQKIVFDYGPFASSYAALSTAQQVAVLDVVPGQGGSVTFANVPLLNHQSVTIEITDVAPTLDHVTLSIF